VCAFVCVCVCVCVCVRAHAGPGPGGHEGLARPGQPTFRYWIDFQVLNSPSSAALLERAFRM